MKKKEFINLFRAKTDEFPLLDRAIAETIGQVFLTDDLVSTAHELDTLTPQDFKEALVFGVGKPTIEKIKSTARLAITHKIFGDPNNPKSFF